MSNFFFKETQIRTLWLKNMVIGHLKAKKTIRRNPLVQHLNTLTIKNVNTFGPDKKCNLYVICDPSVHTHIQGNLNVYTVGSF